MPARLVTAAAHAPAHAPAHLIPVTAVAVVLGVALSIPTAHASGVHAGVPIADVVALHAQAEPRPRTPAFGTVDTGWSLIVPGGLVFIYVAHDEAAVATWLELQLQRQRQPPAVVEQPAQGVDHAWRRGTDFALLADGNIGIMVQGTKEATEEAAVVRSLIVDSAPPWPAPPQLSLGADQHWSVDAPDALQISWQGGRRAPGPGPTFITPPDKLVSWDDLGRAAVAWPNGGEPDTVRLGTDVFPVVPPAVPRPPDP